jgi:DNA-binding beta-propeller fold protein YncE
MNPGLSAALFLLMLLPTSAQVAVPPPGPPPPVLNFENPTVHGVDLSPSGKLLAVCNLPDGRVEFFSTANGQLTPITSVPVGIDPVSVRFRTEDEVWVVNYISQSINVISTESYNITALIQTEPRPTDVIFAGDPNRAFVAESLYNQIAVFDPITHERLTSIAVQAQRPTALAVSPDGQTVFCTVKESGNKTTILSRKLTQLTAPSAPGAVQDRRGPYKGRSPVPNAGDELDPPVNPKVGTNTAPHTGIIVRKSDSGRWLDGNQRDWTEFVSGTNAPMSGRMVGWDMLDHDLVIIDANNLNLSYVDSLMTICLGIGVNPANGNITVVGTEAFNEIRFEPKLNGVFASVLVANVSPSTRAAAIRDLNPHLTYQTSSIPFVERIRSIGDPRGIQWTSDGTRCFVLGRGSDNLLVLDAQGARVGDPIKLPEGPESLALNEAQNRIYILNRFDASVSVLDLETFEPVQTIRLFDPTPRSIKVGRKLLYNTHLTSGLGHLSCATCHVDGRMDRLAWDLGDPEGEFKRLRPGSLIGTFNNLHPMKGPMVTQTFQDIIGHEPLHWRGDRFKIEEFDVTFRDLLGMERRLGRIEMRKFKDLLKAIHFPPNPNRKLNGDYSTNLPLRGFVASGKIGRAAGEPLPNGDALRGSRFGDCIGCHSIPSGLGRTRLFDTNGLVIVQSFTLAQAENLPFKAVHFRNLYERTGLSYSSTNSTVGFGFLHDGRVDTLERYLLEGSSAGVRFTNDQQVADVIAFLISAGNKDASTSPGARNPGAHAAVGRQFSLNETNFAPLIAQFEFPIRQQHGIELSVRGIISNAPSGWLLTRTNARFVGARRSLTMTTNQLHAIIKTNNTFILTVLPEGSGSRLVQDRDLDGVFDADEMAGGSNPSDQFAALRNTAPKLEAIRDQVVQAGQKLQLDVKALDSDTPAQRITYRIATPPVTGARIDSITGTFTFEPTTEQAGDVFFFEVVALDSGSPRLTNSVHFAATVVPPLNVRAADGAIGLSWLSKPEQSFRLDYKNDVADLNWSVLSDEIVAQGGQTGTVDRAQEPRRFYRLTLD